jgi:hypothetical protein
MTSIDSFGTFSALHSMLTLAAGNRVFAQTRSDVLKDWPILMGFFPYFAQIDNQRSLYMSLTAIESD